MTKQAKDKITKINSLTGLKVLAMMLIFWWHAPIKNPSADLGARMCELLFVCSGFLVGYNYLRKSKGEKPTWKDSFDYLKKKFLQVWPVHAICAIVCLVFLSSVPIFNGQTAIRLVFNLLLVQAWLPGQANFFSFNGASWFLSALLFCYFLSPMLCSAISNKRKALILLLVVCSLRIGLELISIHFPGQFFDISFHTFPPVRALEFFMGILLVPLYQILTQKRQKKESTRKSFVFYTIIELLSLAFISFVIFNFDKSWIRGYFVAAFLPLVLVFSLDGGAISRLFSLKPLLLFSKIQFNFYLLHQVVIHLVSKYKALDFLPNNVTKTITIFVVILALSVGFFCLDALFRNLLKKTKGAQRKAVSKH